MFSLTENKYPRVSQLSLKDKFFWIDKEVIEILAKHITISELKQQLKNFLVTKTSSFEYSFIFYFLKDEIISQYYCLVFD